MILLRSGVARLLPLPSANSQDAVTRIHDIDVADTITDESTARDAFPK